VFGAASGCFRLTATGGWRAVGGHHKSAATGTAGTGSRPTPGSPPAREFRVGLTCHTVHSGSVVHTVYLSITPNSV